MYQCLEIDSETVCIISLPFEYLYIPVWERALYKLFLSNPVLFCMQ